MAKAFDTVNHTLLLKKLDKLGFTGNLWKLMEDYLKNRKQKTIVNGITSQAKNVQCGIPQGSTVSPLLFILYMNDLSAILKTLTLCR